MQFQFGAGHHVSLPPIWPNATHCCGPAPLPRARERRIFHCTGGMQGIVHGLTRVLHPRAGAGTMAKRGGKGDADFTSWTRARRFGIEISGSALRGITIWQRGSWAVRFFSVSLQEKEENPVFYNYDRKKFPPGLRP